MPKPKKDEAKTIKSVEMSDELVVVVNRVKGSRSFSSFIRAAVLDKLRAMGEWSKEPTYTARRRE